MNTPMIARTAAALVAGFWGLAWSEAPAWDGGARAPRWEASRLERQAESGRRFRLPGESGDPPGRTAGPGPGERP